MAKEFVTRQLRWDIDWSSLLIMLVLTALPFFGSFPGGMRDAFFLSAVMLICCVVALRPRFIARRWGVAVLQLDESEVLSLRVAAILQEFPETPLVRRMFPPCTGGWLYVTNRRLVFRSRKRTVSTAFEGIRRIHSDPPRTRWWWWVYANVGRIHIETADAVVTIRVRYSHLLRHEIAEQMQTRLAQQ